MGKWVDICYCELITVWVVIAADKKIITTVATCRDTLCSEIYTARLVMDRVPPNNDTVSYIVILSF